MIPLINYLITDTRQAVTHIRESRRFESMYTKFLGIIKRIKGFWKQKNNKNKMGFYRAKKTHKLIRLTICVRG
jgi:hypothetical protein